MLAEKPSGQIVEVPLVGITEEAGWYGYVSAIDREAEVGVPQVVYGHSGAPIYRDGNLVGAMARGLDFYGNDYAFGARSISSVQWWSRWAAERYCPPTIDGGAPGNLEGPGDVVRCATIWGHFENGSVGTVTEVDGRILSLFAHSTIGPHGPINRVILEAEVTGYKEQMLGQLTVETRTGEPLGAVFFQSPMGLVGVEGAVPSHFSVSVVGLTSHGIEERRYNVVINHDLSIEYRQLLREINAVFLECDANRAVFSITDSDPGTPDPGEYYLASRARAIDWVVDTAGSGASWTIRLVP